MILQLTEIFDTSLETTLQKLIRIHLKMYICINTTHVKEIN